MVAEKYKIQCYKAKLVKERTITLPRKQITCVDDSVAIVRAIIGNQPNESVLCLWLTANNDFIGYQEIARGGIHACALTPRDVLAGILMRGVSVFILAHNHPSGNPDPSSEDIRFTGEIKMGAQILGVTLLDHVIVTPMGGDTSSFAQMGLL